ncbi:MAG: ATPase, partial [Alphaproteobacteria bacterium]|nr:ATPase [Alphaproteobacteria bacterium]
DSKIVPIEVKAGENLRARSLAFYNEKYSPEICVRTSLADYKQTENLYDIPLYMVGSSCCQE